MNQIEIKNAFITNAKTNGQTNAAKMNLPVRPIFGGAFCCDAIFPSSLVSSFRPTFI